jgi:hypothetical protein
VVSQASYWLHLREGSVCAIKHIKGLPGVHTQGATASGAGRDPSPAASSGSTSSEDGSPTPETQASSESPGSGNSTSSGAGANETMPTDKGVAADVPVSSRKARRVSLSFVYKPRLCPWMSVLKLNSAAVQTWLVQLLASSFCLLSFKSQSWLW